MNKNGKSYNSSIESHRKRADIKGYYKLRKAELIYALEATRIVQQKSNIFDEQIPNDPSPILQPTPWRPSNFAAKSKKKKKNIY